MLAVHNPNIQTTTRLLQDTSTFYNFIPLELCVCVVHILVCTTNTHTHIPAHIIILLICAEIFRANSLHLSTLSSINSDVMLACIHKYRCYISGLHVSCVWYCSLPVFISLSIHRWQSTWWRSSRYMAAIVFINSVMGGVWWHLVIDISHE